MATIIKDLEEKIGSEKVEEIVEKEWAVVEPPTPEELAQEESKNPKARNNPNSRKNLAQYNKRSKKAKEKALDNLKVVEKEEDVNPRDVFGEVFDQKTIDLFENIVRPREVFKNRAEQEIYWDTIKGFLEDFEVKELTYSDIDDIATLAKFRVIEYRILKVAQHEKLVLEAMPSIEKLRKDTDKIKGNLASRRVDRIDTKNKPALSIVDLAAHLDQQNKLDFAKRLEELENRQSDYSAPLRDAEGNLIEDE